MIPMEKVCEELTSYSKNICPELQLEFRVPPQDAHVIVSEMAITRTVVFTYRELFMCGAKDNPAYFNSLFKTKINDAIFAMATVILDSEIK